MNKLTFARWTKSSTPNECLCCSISASCANKPLLANTFARSTLSVALPGRCAAPSGQYMNKTFFFKYTFYFSTKMILPVGKNLKDSKILTVQE